MDVGLLGFMAESATCEVGGGGDMGGEERPSMLASQPGWEVMVVFLFCGFGGVCACACDLGEMEAGDRGSG